MTSLRPLFLRHVAQTSTAPLIVEVERAHGIYLYDIHGREYIDLTAGICVSALGHGHPQVVEAIRAQAGRYLHTNVYGEHVQAPQVELARLLTQQLDASLDSVYFVNSGSEAIEGALKLARRVTGRYEIVACRNAYHGSTAGAESLRSDIAFTGAFAPHVPGIRHIQFNATNDIEMITTRTAAVIMEPVQAEAGVRLPSNGYLTSVRQRCQEVGALLIFDEIQTGMGRTGSLFAYQHYGVAPDLLIIAKGFGGGLPLGAFIGRREYLSVFTGEPAPGHITTFGGHPLSCTAALATLQVILKEQLHRNVPDKSAQFAGRLQHPRIREIRRSGLLMAVELDGDITAEMAARKALARGLLTDWFLFDGRSLRIAPPLIIAEDEIDRACAILCEVFDELA